MVGFDKKDKESFGVREAKPGEWYQFDHYNHAGDFGRFLKIDDLFAYFDEAISEIQNETGAENVIKQGEIAVNLQSITNFFPANLQEVELSLANLNWHRQYLDQWVAVTSPHMPPAIGKACKVYRNAFHLKPYISEIGTRQMLEDKEKVVIFAPPTTIEVITKEQLERFIGHI